MKLSPCLNCTERKIGCHSDCSLYLVYRSNVDNANKNRYNTSELNTFFTNTSRDRKFKAIKNGGKLW